MCVCARSTRMLIVYEQLIHLEAQWFLHFDKACKNQLNRTVHIKHGKAEPESKVASDLCSQLEDVHAEIYDHHGHLLVHDQLDHAAVVPWRLGGQGGADVEGGAGGGAVGRFAVDGHVVKIIFHLGIVKIVN